MRVLGPLEVEVAGSVVTVPGARQQALLVLLVVHRGEVVSASRIADALWGESLPADSANAVQTAVSRLRRTLGAAAIGTEAHGYRLRLGPECIDAARFEQLCLRARGDRDPAISTATAREALSLWQGRPFGDHGDGLARSSAVRLEELRTSTLELVAEQALAQGQLEEAVSRARELHGEHPLRDRPVAILMRALHGAGRTAEALETFRLHRAVLDDELGLTPSSALRELEAGILRDDPAAGPPLAPDTRPPPAPARKPTSVSDAPRTTLPWRPSAIVGRAEELDAIDVVSATAPVVTLVGPGGVGKTRLALEVAHTAQLRGAETWWVDLVAVPASGLVEKVAEGTGLEIARLDDPTGVLASALCTRTGLLCLDNAEHMLDDLAVLVERIAAETSTLRILVTSRQRLGLDCETTVVLPPLGVDGSPSAPSAASQLFVTRWWRGESPPSQDRLADVDHLCRELDGLPLAIELAAAQTSILGLDEVTERLTGRLDLLTGGRRTAAERHRSLRAVVDWSFRDLQPEEAALLARLAVFPGRFTLAQAEQVCGDATVAPTAALLSRLVEKSLVQAGPHGFWLLETIRSYAVERQSDADRALVADRHARDTLARLETQAARLWSAEEGEASRVLGEMSKDLAAAWRHSVEHDHDVALALVLTSSSYAYFRQRLDMLRWSLTLLERVPSLGSVPELLAAAAASSWSAGDLDAALQLARRGIEAAGGPDRPRARSSLDVCADIEMFHGRMNEAAALYRAGGVLAEHPAEAFMFETAAMQALSYGPQWTDNVERVEALVERAHGFAVPSVLSFACFAAGETWVHADVARALAAFERAADEAQAVGSTLLAMIARGQSVSERTVGEPVPPIAAELLTLLDGWERLDNEPGVWSALGDAVVVLTRAEQWETAAVLHASVAAHGDRTWRLPRPIARLESAHAVLRERAHGVAGPPRPETRLGRRAAVRLARQALAERAGASADSPASGT